VLNSFKQPPATKTGAQTRDNNRINKLPLVQREAKENFHYHTRRVSNDLNFEAEKRVGIGCALPTARAISSH
jgi:hypothetical protein